MKLLLTLLVFFPAVLFAQTWTEMSDGHHSLQEAGSEFYVSVPVRRVEGARLVLFNKRVAQRLGLKLPDRPEELEKIILDHFAYLVSKEPTGDKTWMATYYQDSNSKGPGEARGDGRALWSGELLLNVDGHSYPIDVVLKGVGQTPLAWLNHGDIDHKDGYQFMHEAVHSFVVSEINDRNELNTTVDLAVIELPIKKMNKKTGQMENVSITIRVGEQTRLAHFRYWADDPARFGEFFRYVVRRTFGMKKDAQVTQEHIDAYFWKLALGLADEAARYYDLHGVHSSPTMGNRTTSGATIDLGTFRYLDAHHSSYSYLFDQLRLGGEKGQVQQMRRYLEFVHHYALSGGIQLNVEQAKQIFDRQFEKHLTQAWLHRLGLDPGSVGKLSEPTRQSFYRLMRKIYEMESDRSFQFENSAMRTAALEPRRIFAGALATLGRPAAEQGTALVNLFLSDRPWAQNPSPELRGKIVHAAQELLDLMNEIRREVPAFSENLPRFAEQARMINAQRRPDMSLGYKNEDRMEAPIMNAIKAGQENFEQITARALELVPSLVDQGLLLNPVTNLGPKKAPPAGGTRQCRRALL